MVRMEEIGVGTELEGGWTFRSKLGEGNFGAVWKVEREEGETFAIKIESTKGNAQILKMEVLVLKRLNAAKAKHACCLVARGHTESFNYVVMSLAGPSLSYLRKKRRGGCFDQGSALRITSQCLAALEELHQIGFVHRDIKPGNFAVEAGKRPSLVLILDFGLARAIFDTKGAARKPRPDAGFRGTLHYAPVNGHRGLELGRKDDLESLFYQHWDLSVPTKLPWAHSSDKATILVEKQEARSDAAFFQPLPEAMQDFILYLDDLPSPNLPDYSLLQTLLREAATSIHSNLNQPIQFYDA